MKHVITNALPQGVEHFEGTMNAGQLHFIVDDSQEVPNSTYEATWDGKAKTIKVLKGDNSAVKMRYMGWPSAAK